MDLRSYAPLDIDHSRIDVFESLAAVYLRADDSSRGQVQFLHGSRVILSEFADAVGQFIRFLQQRRRASGGG